MQVLREIQMEYEQRLECAKADLCSAYEAKASLLRYSGGGVCGVLVDATSDASLADLRSVLADQRQLVSNLEEAVSFLNLALHRFARFHTSVSF